MFIDIYIYIYREREIHIYHMLVSKIKPRMSKYKFVVRRNCAWLIKTVIIVCLMVMLTEI